jgi:hypothetical protein
MGRMMLAVAALEASSVRKAVIVVIMSRMRPGDM